MNEPFVDHTVISPDGTEIAYRTIGRGPALVIVHGTFRAAVHYEQLARLLSDTFTVCIMDRRGRGGSGPMDADYSFRREREDLAAVLAQTSAELVFGHSLGGLIALEAAAALPLRQIAIYEPPITAHMVPTGWIAEFEKALAEQDYVHSLILFFKAVGGNHIPDEQLENIRQHIHHHPEWPSMVQLLPTLPIEVREAARAVADMEKYRDVSAETLLMIGTENPDFKQPEVIRAFERLVPHSRTVMLPGLGHNAPDMDAPEPVAQQLKAFFNR
ncbi:alpha/beta fold hydrolase [Paenibacillus humicola]|uniref:alpha/beta fold hydrolase n=1 Tax=Paenibacillus humicola TaxID=3110540 RepID=UPI00237B3CCA|nr:alpha/beta hydrolase [Paenibacillus humicola]